VPFIGRKFHYAWCAVLAVEMYYISVIMSFASQHCVHILLLLSSFISNSFDRNTRCYCSSEW